MNTPLLPSEFADLEPYAAKWCLPNEPARYATRLSSTMDELQSFYDAMFPRGEAVLDYLDQFPLDDDARRRGATPPPDVRIDHRLVHGRGVPSTPDPRYRSRSDEFHHRAGPLSLR